MARLTKEQIIEQYQADLDEAARVYNDACERARETCKAAMKAAIAEEQQINA